MIKNKVRLWRIFAIISTFLWSLIFFANKAYSIAETGLSEISSLVSDAFSFFSILISIVLIIFPMQFYLYSVLYCLFGLAITIYDGSPNAILIYLLGCSFAYHKQFFDRPEPKHELKKGVLLIIPLLIAIAFQYRLGEHVWLESIFTLLFLTVFFVLMYFLVIDPFFVQKKIHYSEQVEKLDLSELTVEEIQLLKEVINNKTFYAIARDRNKSESSIKQMMSGIYKKLEIFNKAHLLQLYEEEKLIFPK